MVNKCIENLEKLVNLKTSADRALYVGSIERLQLAVCSEGEILLSCLPISFFLFFPFTLNAQTKETFEILFFICQVVEFVVCVSYNVLIFANV